MTVAGTTPESDAWFDELDDRDREAVMRVVRMLESKGITLGEPHSTALRGSRFPFRELRRKRGRSPLRVIYAFDPRREALVILGGDKAAEPRFYSRAMARAEALWIVHLEDTESEEGP
jgi:hypothetical protein